MEDLAKIAANLEGAGQPLWLWDAERRRIVWANRAGREFWGADSLFDLAAKSFPPGGPETRAMAQTGTGIEGILNLPGGPVGASLDIALVGVPLTPGARVVRLSHIREKRRESWAALRGDLFLSAPIGLCLTDAHGGMLGSNDAWIKLTGARGQSLAMLAGEEKASRFLLNCIASGRAELSVYAEGRRLRLFGKRLKRPGDERPYVYLRGEDVTVEHALETLLVKRAEAISPEAETETNAPVPQDGLNSVPEAIPEAGARTEESDNVPSRAELIARASQAEQKSHAKSELIAKLTHEMRNPLNAIVGFAEIMQQAHFGRLGDLRYEAYAGEIRINAEELLSLVNDLLDLAQIEAGQLRLAFDGLALSSLVEDCVRLLRPEAMKNGVSLETSIPEALPAVFADARSLKQVLINLLSNAVKFTAEGGRVTVSADADEHGAVTLRVTDTGIGMNHGEVQLALQPFGQIPGPVSRGRHGAGLGLPVAKALAEANNAEFHIDSVPARGTTIELTFPPAVAS